MNFPSVYIYLSKVIPVHKKGCIGDYNNYRPISIISTLSKISETFYITKYRILLLAILIKMIQTKLFDRNISINNFNCFKISFF